ncbi:hypothetical protein CQW49_13680 [Methylosinus trichosporium OB3b]|uniref:Uncharacterized protein n=1 Tax=Methylosinus trichosporium (strain ATCC 35070 / NCIMB 11131 / UNIQEM 75 / OB3b) TaxID=595536 RepID=A0A2D2D1G7_METT3|nr:hypothetical protein CQW49_13680 [Methylosinus trichosporium OB3b]OBS51497.1 hypothetical protein A8B73_16045 [Methylosinus sp. 3S-1]
MIEHSSVPRTRYPRKSSALAIVASERRKEGDEHEIAATRNRGERLEGALTLISSCVGMATILLLFSLTATSR